MGKRVGLSVVKKNSRCVPTKEQYSGSNQYCVGDIHSEK
jgi:hypothetical protein